MELGEPALVAAMAAYANEGTAPKITQPHGPLYSRRYMPGRRLLYPAARFISLAALAGSRPGGIGELLLRQIGEQHRQGPIQHLGHVTRRDRMAEHVLGEPQLLERAATDRDLQLVAVRRERADCCDRRRHGRSDRWPLIPFRWSSNRRPDIGRGCDVGLCGSGRRLHRGRAEAGGTKLSVRLGHSANRCRHVWTRRQPRYDLLDLGLRLATGGLQHLLVIRDREMRGETPDAGQMDR